MHTLRTRALARRSLSSFSLLRFYRLQRCLSANTPIADSDRAVQNKVLVEAKACARPAILNRPVGLNALTTNMVAILDGITIGGGVGVSNPWTFREATDKTLRNARHFSTDAGSSFSRHVGRSFLFRGHKQLRCMLPCSVRMLSSNSSTPSSQQAPKEGTRKDISTVEDPFDAPTYHIPEKPITFTEGASYSVVILAGLGIAGLAAYAVFKELIFEPKEYKVFGKALERIQRDSQVTVRIGSPVTGYGSESRNRAARQRIPNRVWTDEDGVEHVEVNFYIRGPHGAGKVYTEMFKDSSDNKWKFTYLIVEIKSPTHAQLMLESYVPA